MNKIVIAEPIYHAMPPQIYSNRIAFWKEVFAMEDIGICLAGSDVMGPRKGIRDARKEAIDLMMERKASHILFLDDDCKVTPTVLGQLLAVDRPIVGVPINRDDGNMIVFRDARLGDDTPSRAAYLGYNIGYEEGEILWEDYPRTHPFECAALGSGCMLIQREVFEGIRRKFNNYYFFTYDDTPRSMDVRFCRMAREAGFQVWCEPRVYCEQIKHYD